MSESREQEVVKDSVTGLYESPKDKGPEDYSTTEEHLSPWQKEWRRIGMEMERMQSEIPRPGTEGIDCLNALTVESVIHAQSLKRVDP